MSIYPLFDHVLVAEIPPCKFFGRSIGIKMFKFLCFVLLDANQNIEPSSTEEFLIDPSCKPASYWRPPFPPSLKERLEWKKEMLTACESCYLLRVCMFTSAHRLAQAQYQVTQKGRKSS